MRNSPDFLPGIWGGSVITTICTGPKARLRKLLSEFRFTSLQALLVDRAPEKSLEQFAAAGLPYVW